MTSTGLIVVIAVGACACTLVVLFSYKIVMGAKRRFEGVRRAAYIAVIGELAARGSYPTGILSDWAADRVFRSTLQGFVALVEGVERSRLLQVAQDLGIIDDEVGRLRSRRTKQRVRAAQALAAFGDPLTARALSTAINDRAAAVRVNALAGLSRIGEPELVAKILRTVDSETEWDAARIMDQLVALGAPAVPALLSYLGDLRAGAPRYATMAIQTLGAIGDLSSQRVLLDGLHHPEVELRAASAGALQRMGSVGAVPGLIEAMRDREAVVRIRAAKSLGESFDESAVDALAHGLRDPEWWVRKNSAESLTRLPGGVGALQEALRGSDEFARDAAREQLMIMGVPAGAPVDTTPINGQTDGSADGDWIAEQLDQLDTGFAQRPGVPDTPTPGTRHPSSR